MYMYMLPVGYYIIKYGNMYVILEIDKDNYGLPKMLPKETNNCTI